jgi:hypothetical protein
MLVYARIACMYASNCTYCIYVLCILSCFLSMSTYNTIFMLNMFFASMCLRTWHINWHTKAFFIFSVQVSKANWLVVNRPDHGPGVDVEQGAARAGLQVTSTYWQGAGGACTDTHCQWHWNMSRFIYLHIRAYTCIYVLFILSRFLPKSLTYMHILTYTCIYLHIHADTYIY